jgi:formylglycine-generating enzyme required for sulfatase activity
MITIPAGKFFMGSDDPDALPMEKPQHKVTLHAYCMDRTEVTLSAYKACSDAGGCNRAGVMNAWPGITAKEKETYDPLCNANEPEKRGDHPVNCVDHAQAANYCREQGKRLPTEAEWEYAARGPDGRRYPWGDSPPSADRMNACGSECAKWGKGVHLELPAMFSGDDGWVHTAPVGSFPSGASRYGLVDVVGNVWEWVSDGYGPYADVEATDPTGSADATTRVIRGGAWNGSAASWVRPTFRYGSAPAIRSHGIGFRCAADLR